MIYGYGKPALRMQCPHCGEQDEHHVVHTDPANYRWSDELTPLFKRLVGRDIAFRRRTKKCSCCDREFLTVEMANIYLEALIGEVQRLTAEHMRITIKWADAEIKVANVQQAVNEAANVLEPLRTAVDTSRSQSASTERGVSDFSGQTPVAAIS